MIGFSFVYPQYLWLLLVIPLVIILALMSRRSMNQVRLWTGITIRAILLGMIILALSGLQVRLPSRTLTTIFILDASDSISPQEQAHGEDIIRQAVQSMPNGDRSAIVVFGEDALVERLANEDSSLSKITSTPITTRTNISSAIQLAMALFPDEGARRLVLLSDGRENLSLAMKQAELAAFQQIELLYFPLGETQEEIEVLVSGLDAPSGIREGQEFDLGITIDSSAAVGASLRVFIEDQLFHTQDVNLRQGTNRYNVTIQNPEAGFRRFRVQVIPDADHRLQNNEASAYTVVYGPPNILLVEGTLGDGDNLLAALQESNMRVTMIQPGDLPSTLPELAQYESVILVNVPAASIPVGAMEALPVYVRDLGKGLLMVGGENSFGAGGYLRTPIEEAMPVYMDVKSRELAANLALVVAVDKSGSMGRCHCDDPDLNQTYTAVETGQPKVDIAKEAIMRSAGALGEEDYLGVVTFDEQAHWAVNPQLLPGQNVLENAIGTFRAEGQTNMFTGVSEAYSALQEINAKRKHIILMTDGWVRTGDLIPLANQMREEGITLSVIAAGEGSAEYLEDLSEAGGGRYYPAVDMMSVPEVFLKETVKSIGQYIIEEPFYPLPASISPVMRGLDETDLPGLFGYNGTSPKNAARTDLITPRGDPLLASWQYGLGRAAAWTSDMKGRWASNWVQWNDFAQFSSQLVNWLLPAPQIEGLDAKAQISDDGMIIQLNAEDDQGRPLNFLTVDGKLIDPQLNSIDMTLEQVGPGSYQVVTRADQPGAYLVWLGITNDQVPLGQMTLGMVVPYSPEYRAGGINYGLLEALARSTGGGLLKEPIEAFIHNLPALENAREVWQILLLIAVFIFPVDVALRRLVVTRRDFQKAWMWITDLVVRRRPISRPKERMIFNALFNARERARKRTGQTATNQSAMSNDDLDDGSSPVNRVQTEVRETHLPKDEVIQTDQVTTVNQDSLSRLRAAKKRARKE